jgi:hypothetical protein
MKKKKNIFFQFYKFFIISIFIFSSGLLQAKDFSWEERETQFHEIDNAWIAEEKTKEKDFFKNDSLFFEEDENWQKEKDLNGLENDREWIRSEKD